MFRRQEAEAAGWDPEQAESLLGKRALVGLTFIGQDGQVLERAQRHGRIVAADPERGVAVSVIGHGQRWDGEWLWLPPDLERFHLAEPGVYQMRGTEEVVSDPDLVVSWVVATPAPEDDRPEWQRARAEHAQRLGFSG